jgi:CheY-like chemotaxis protein
VTIYHDNRRRVATAGSLAEAIEQSAAHGDIQLLVTDYHLANQETGVQVIAAVRSQLSADLKAILITGDTSAAAHAIQYNDRVRMTSKPINADEFIGLLRELIEV